MNKSFDVITFMDLCTDTLLYGSDIVPQFGQTEKLIENYSIGMGGSCSIFACQVAKLGLRTAGAGVVGSDLMGTVVLDTLRDAGVALDYVAVNPAWRTGFSVALCTPEDRAILTYEGTIDALTPADVPESLLMNARHLHIGSYYLLKKMQPHWTDIVRKAKQYGATVSLDTNWDPEGRWANGIDALLPLVDIFLPNEAELRAVARAGTTEEALSKLLRDIPLIALKRGAEGASVYTRDGAAFHAAPYPVRVVDAVGAGDNFDAGFIFGYVSGLPIEACLQIACFCGSMSTRNSGGVSAQIGEAELKMLLAR